MPTDTDKPIPDYSYVLGANSHGKEVVGIKHGDKNLKKGCFLLYNYTDTYIFKADIVKKAVR